MNERIPVEIESLLLAAMPGATETATEAKPRGFLRGLLEPRAGPAAAPIPLGRELVFWTIEPDAELEAFLFSHLLPALDPHAMRGLWGELPPGYRPLVQVLEFEQQRQIRGWAAVAHLGPSKVDAVIQGYRHVGLADEAASLEVVLDRYRLSRNDSASLDTELQALYEVQGHDFPSFEARMPVILDFVRTHPEFFAAPL